MKKPPSYKVSGGPMMVTCHCKMFESSTKPAEKPSIGFRVKSVSCFKRTSRITPHRQRGVSSRKGKKETPPVRDLTTRYERKEKLDCPPRPFCPRRSGSVRCIITSSRTKKTRLLWAHASVPLTSQLISQQNHRLIAHLRPSFSSSSSLPFFSFRR